jgi:hypothetical protein
MKVKLTTLLAIAVATVALGATSFAGPAPESYQHHVRSRDEADKLPAKTHVAFACASCKTFKPIEDRKTFLSFFAPDQKHGCDGCGGKVTIKQVPSGQGNTVSIGEYTHTCSKCGSKSAYTCSAHKS